METIQCLECLYNFEVEDYDSGHCPNCNKMRYYWTDNWDYETDETGWIGFEWEYNV